MSAGRLLAFRLVAAVHRLPARSQACPLSPRHLLASLGPGRPLPIFLAPFPALARAALLAAAQAGSAVGLALPRAQRPEPWFDAAAAAADELAPRLPFFLSGLVEVGPGERELERAEGRAHRLVEAGLTHLALDVSAVAGADRARAAARVAAFAVEREVALECLLPGPEAAPDPEEAAAFLEELGSWGLSPDALGARCPAPAGPGEARAQARALAAAAAALGATPLVRRGPASGAVYAACRGARLAAVDDGGGLLRAGLRALPEARRGEVARRLEEGAAPSLPEADAARLEGMAFAAAEAAIEALGSGGTAAAAASGLA